MFNSSLTPARVYAKGIGGAVADRTINRKKVDGSIETWADVAHRVSVGNTSLLQEDHADDIAFEFNKMHHHMRQASLLMSGRHLQHGDENQLHRNQEVFTNCSTSALRSLTFYLLLNGSGVGEDFSNDMMLVDYKNMPVIVPVIDSHHQDVQTGEITVLDRRNAEHLYAGRKQHYFRVPDSREGWAKAVEQIETLTFLGTLKECALILDFTDVRPRNSPIAGMQSRPASGPGPLIDALKKVGTLREANMAAWRSNMYASHYLSECVLVGGARRAARMATKTWRDADVLDFIGVKKGGFLWSSNNSVTVDEEFWLYVKDEFADKHGYFDPEMSDHAKAVFNAICEHSYKDGTGEPGLINVDKLTWKAEGMEDLLNGDFAESSRYKLDPLTLRLTSALAKAFSASDNPVITNPCGEIALSKLGGYCVIADVVPFHAGTVSKDPILKLGTIQEWDADAEDAFRTATRALIRVNTMDSLYHKEVKRTNRIGVGMTGIHEYAWARFGFGWHDLIDEQVSLPFWLTLSRFARAVSDEAKMYSARMGLVTPHTDRTIKPAGTTSKLFGLTEGAHLPSMREYVRWVQFRNDDPLVAEYQAKGYPTQRLITYNGTTVVGFPTRPQICELGMGHKLVTAGEATPEEQYQYLRLLEKYWITGVENDGVTPLVETGNQVSYTLKYRPDLVSFEEFKRTLLEGQSTIRACSVMPQADTSAYEYLPEQQVSKHDYEQIAQAIQDEMNQKEDVGLEHVDCSSGACPITWNEKVAA